MVQISFILRLQKPHFPTKRNERMSEAKCTSEAECTSEASRAEQANGFAYEGTDKRVAQYLHPDFWLF